MSTRSELIAARATAGATYASAIAAWRAAYIELAALDIVVANATQGGDGFARSFTGEVASTGVPWPLRHPVYAASELAGIDDAVRSRAENVMRGGL